MIGRKTNSVVNQTTNPRPDQQPTSRISFHSTTTQLLSLLITPPYHRSKSIITILPKLQQLPPFFLQNYKQSNI